VHSLLFIVLTCSNFPVPRVADGTWKGRKILPRQSPAAIFVDHRYLFDFDDFSLLDSFPYEVRDEKDNWLKIFDGEREGWAQKSNFVKQEDSPALWEDMLKRDPKNAFALNMRGISRRLNGEFDSAIKDFDDVIVLKPGHLSALNNRGLAYLSKNEHELAIKDFDEVVFFDPENASAFNNRGIVHLAKKDFDLAIKDFEKSILLKPHYVIPYLNRGDAYAQKKQCELAIRDFDEVIRIDPESALAHYGKTCAYALQKRTDMAIDQLRKCFELGYTEFRHMEIDSDLDSIREDPRYKELVRKYKK
jgi:tetratricopeptide (TPR) repeat protein